MSALNILIMISSFVSLAFVGIALLLSRIEPTEREERDEL